MQKRKICFAITSITNNGVTRVISILLNHIDYDRYDVSVLLTRKVERKGSFDPRARIIEVENDIGDSIGGKIRNIWAIRKIIRKEKFSLIIALGDYAALYTLLACIGVKVKKIVSERNDPNREPDKLMFRKLRDFLYRRVDAIVCQTADASRYFEHIVPRRIVIHNPITPGLPTADAGEREKRVVNFCRIDSQKNLPLLIDAFEEFAQTEPEYTLDIYGDGPDEKKIRGYIEQKGLSGRVRMHGFCADIHEKIKNAAMFVSSSDFEGMSNSMLEALAIGLPSICTDCPIGGAHEVIESGVNGILVPVGDQGAMAEAMRRVAGDREFAKALSQNGMRIRQTLSQNVICRQWWELLDNTK